MARLRSARLTDATLVSQIDDFLGELESDICSIFGFTLDSDVTANAFGLDNSGRLTKQLVRSASAMARNGYRSVGIGITNSTNGTVAQLGERLVELPGDHALPMMCFGIFDVTTAKDIDASLAGLAVMFSGYDGQLIGYKFTSAAQGLVPRGSGNVDEYLRSDGAWVAIGNTATVAIATNPTSPLNMNASNILVWNYDVSDSAGLHAVPDDDFIIVDAGKYHCGVQCSIFPDIDSVGTLNMVIVRERAAVRTYWGSVTIPCDPAHDAQNNLASDAVIDCNASDKISFELTFTVAGIPTTLSIPTGELNSRAWVVRVA